MKKQVICVTFLAMMAMMASCKKDAEVNKDTFKVENETIEASTQSVRIAGNYAYAGAINAITIELGRQSDLTDADAYRAILDGTSYSVEIGNLRTNTTYYYRYAVDYGGKTPYRMETKSFATLDYNLPEVETKAIESVGITRAEVRGEVKGDGGGDPVTLRGVCWSTRHNPSVGDEYTNAGEGQGIFNCELTNLQPQKTYYARAFAGNSKGIAYGAELTFVTLDAGSLAEVHTLGVVGNAMLEATIESEVTAEGATAVLERGVCYSKEHYPLTSGLHVSSGTGTGAFTCLLTNLEAGATYYVRAYAINSLGISYGEEMSFTAMTEMTAPVVVTYMVKDIAESSATGSGEVVSNGGSDVTRRGLCWSEQPEPTVEGTHADCGVGIGAFNCLIPRLNDQTTYYVRAYAENAIGMAYGEEVSFTIGQHEPVDVPDVVTFDVLDITQTTAIGSGEIMDEGGSFVTERGLCWSTSHNPTINNSSHASLGNGGGFFEGEMTGLIPNTTYHVRAYARNSAGIAYGNEVDFVTLQVTEPPMVEFGEVNVISPTMVSLNGWVSEYSAATECGFCWNTSPNPTIDNDHQALVYNGNNFNAEITGLTPNTTYYVRAYAINIIGISYSYEIVVTTYPNILGSWQCRLYDENDEPFGELITITLNEDGTANYSTDPNTIGYYSMENGHVVFLLPWEFSGSTHFANCSGELNNMEAPTEISGIYSVEFGGYYISGRFIMVKAKNASKP